MADAVVLEGVAVPLTSGQELAVPAMRVGEAEMVAVLGPSDSGKSALLAVCGGRARPARGRVAVNGHDLHEVTGRAREELLERTVGWLEARVATPQVFTAVEGVTLAAEASGLSGEDSLRTADMALAAAGLDHRRGHRADQLSAGELRRLALALALARAPVLLIADEPTSQLDEGSAHQLLDLLVQAADSGTAVLIATHDPRVASTAQRVYRIEGSNLSESSGAG